MEVHSQKRRSKKEEVKGATLEDELVSFVSRYSGCICFVLSHFTLFAHYFPVALLCADSPAASFVPSLLCPFMCSKLVPLLFLTCCKSGLDFAAMYLLFSALYSPVNFFAAYFES